MLNSSNRMVGALYVWKSTVSQYIELQKINDELAAENVALRNRLRGSFVNVNEHFVMINDTLRERKYIYKSAQVVNSSVNKQLNFITINKGKNDGIEPEMGVMNTNGLVGVVKEVSEHFSTVVPIINVQFIASAELERTGSFGLLRWDGVDARYAYLNDVPRHVDVVSGDTVLTRAASAIYPKGILVGTVAEVAEKNGSNFHQIKVLLSNDFNALRYVNVVDNLLKQEQISIETNFRKDAE